MKESDRSARLARKRTRRNIIVALGVLVLAGVGAVEAEASPIRNRQNVLAAVQQQRQQQWQARQLAALNRQAIQRAMLQERQQNYFARALANRQTQGVVVPNGLQASLVLDENGLLPDTPFIDYLRWRRSLNPTRFDRFHPRIGPLLAQDELVRATLPQLTPGIIPAIPPPPPKIETGGTIDPFQRPLNPSTQIPIPEPSTWIMGMVLVGAGAWAQRRSRRQVNTN